MEAIADLYKIIVWGNCNDLSVEIICRETFD